jgi:hypothetical protein
LTLYLILQLRRVLVRPDEHRLDPRNERDLMVARSRRWKRRWWLENILELPEQALKLL